ncbi:MAG: hypothetical protein ABIU11_05210 [Chitinophagaceae bacterium]
MKKIFISIAIILTAAISISAQSKSSDKPFTKSLMQDSCSFISTGRNMYFILEAVYQLILAGKDGEDSAQLVITVLNETKKIGNTETRVVEENESANGKTIEISRNYFAFCKENNSIYYFGEDVDMYKNGKVLNHEGSWIATGNNHPGILMPGLIFLGARYYQEIAPGIAMDRAEIISNSEKTVTPAGSFINVLKTEETTSLEPKDKEYKLYAPGIGLIKEGNLLLVKYGFLK